MITVTTTASELKKFEGTLYNKRELEILVEKDPEHYFWSYNFGGDLVVEKVYRDNDGYKAIAIGTLNCTGTEIWDW